MTGHETDTTHEPTHRPKGDGTFGPLLIGVGLLLVAMDAFVTGGFRVSILGGLLVVWVHRTPGRGSTGRTGREEAVGGSGADAGGPLRRRPHRGAGKEKPRVSGRFQAAHPGRKLLLLDLNQQPFD